MFKYLKTNRQLQKKIKQMELKYLTELNILIDERDLALKDIEKYKYRINELETDLFNKNGNEMSNQMIVVENNNNWISVKDKLPKDNEQVLVIDNIGYYYVTTFEQMHEYFIEGCELMPIDATHWQSLPELPKAVQPCK